MKKRFFLFSGEAYYPEGGWHDFIGSFETLEKAKEYAMEHRWDWAHVVDFMKKSIVWYSHRDAESG